MTAKERMLTALSRQKPDRLPVTIHQWQDFHLRAYMGGLSAVEAFRWAGLDIAHTPVLTTEPETPVWRHTVTPRRAGDRRFIDHLIRTPEGDLTYVQEQNEYTTWVVEHMIKRDDDITLLKKYKPVCRLDRGALSREYDLVGDGGIVRLFICGFQGGCFQDACELYGAENLIYACFDKPDWVHELLSILLEDKLKFIEANLPHAKVDLVETGGGAASTTVISPAMHRAFCLPYDQKIHAALKTLGHRSVYHTCGGMTALLDILPENGCDASETLSPPGVGGDITDETLVKERLGSHVALIGGMDQINVLPSTPQAVEQEVFRLFEAYGGGGGYILSACDHFFHLPKENLRVFANAAAQCIY